MECPSRKPGSCMAAAIGSETGVAVLTLTLFLAVNLLTASRSPTVWTDEVMFTDPAANLAQGHGFTSTAWFTQSRTEFFAGNSPFYPLCLCPWIACFGLGPVAVRSFSYVLTVAASAVFWRTLAEPGVVRSRWCRAAVVLVALFGCGVTLSYRSARYDCLAMLLMACLWWTVLQRESARRSLGLIVLCAVLPWTGLQLIPYLAALVVLVIAWRGVKGGMRDACVAGTGLLLGAGSLYLLLRWQGAWTNFRNSVLAFSGQSRGPGERLLDAVASLTVDPSMMLLSGLLVAVLGWQLWADRRSPRRAMLLAGAYFALAIPVGLALVGKFPRYYSWMAYIPVAVCLGMWLEQATLNRAATAAIAAIVGLACLLGLPARTAVTLAEWRFRDYGPVVALVQRNVTPRDAVYCDYEAYYAAKAITADVYLPPYCRVITAGERAATSVLVVLPEGAHGAMQFFGGQWTLVAEYDANAARAFSIAGRLGVGSKPYRLAVYRRTL